MRNANPVLALCAALAAAALLPLDASAAPKAPCKGLRAADGSCASKALVNRSQNRSTVGSSERSSYYGSPAGQLGDPYIKPQTAYRQNRQQYGLPKGKK